MTRPPKPEFKDNILALFWRYLHTITIAHDNQPNEPHRQVIYKEEIPQIVDAILEVVRNAVPNAYDELDDYISEKEVHPAREGHLPDKC